MKKYRALVPIVMVVIMAASWYMLITNAAKVEAQYNEYLTAARGYAEDGITKYAIENYTLALEIKSSPELYKEVADYYKAQNKNDDYLDWCEDFLENYPKEAVAYECLIEAYAKDSDYKACYDLIYTAQKRNIKSDYINKISEEIKYVYKLDFSTYDDIGVYSNNFCAVNNKGFWGFVDRYGELRISTKYTNTGAYTQSAFASVVNQSGEAYFIDKSGSKVLVSKDQYSRFGLLVNNVIAAKKTDGKYTYLNNEFEVLFGDYEYASTMNNNRAAVKKDGQWYVINEKGEKVSSQTYVDIILDEKEIAFRNDRMFVSNTEGRYILVDGSGKQIGSLEFEDATLFMGEQPAAVKIGGKWQFINKEGKLVSDKSYEGAKSFLNGLAAVCINGKWGFVDEAENVVIEPKFQDASYFNEKGSCFVKMNDKWQLLKLYRLNREE